MFEFTPLTVAACVAILAVIGVIFVIMIRRELK